MILKTKKQIVAEVADFLNLNSENYDNIAISIEITKPHLANTSSVKKADFYCKLEDNQND